MANVLLGIFLNGKSLTMKKFDIKENLASIRKTLSSLIPKDANFIMDENKILEEDEKDILIEDIIKDKKIYLESNNKNLIDEVKKPKTMNQPLKGSKLIQKTGDLDIYLYPSRMFTAQEEADSKSMMVVGQTGCGKTTLLNSLVNFLTGINFEDKFRYKIIDEGPNQNQAKSQTSEVTVYYIQPHNGYPPIKIIDTPGFGDTGGIEVDKKITKKIEKKFQTEINQINAICFVAQSSNARLTPNQKYIFSSIMDLFGNELRILLRCLLFVMEIFHKLLML